MSVYFIRAIGMCSPVKIGWADRPLERMDQLAVWSPYPLEIVASVEGDMALERRLHGIFSASHSHKEWFVTTPELEALIVRVRSGEDIGSIIDLSAPVLPFRAPTGRWSESRRKLISYRGRFHWAFKDTKLREPRDIDAIMDAWTGRGGQEHVDPTPEQLARLEEVLADPERHGVTWEQWEAAA